MAAWDEVLDFWLEETPPEARFRADPTLDQTIRERFCALHAQLVQAVPEEWRATPRAVLGAIIVLDQFGRNLDRGGPGAFAGDAAARALARDAIAQGWDRAMGEAERHFLYMPLMHSERLADVERCAELMADFTVADAVDYARRHVETIRRFGRYPARNAALGRESTPAEAAFLEANPEGFPSNG